MAFTSAAFSADKKARFPRKQARLQADCQRLSVAKIHSLNSIKPIVFDLFVWNFFSSLNEEESLERMRSGDASAFRINGALFIRPA